jgi:hypothetical protein
MLSRSIGFVVLCLCVSIPAAVFGATQPTLSTTYASFNPWTGQNDGQLGITYQFPDPARFGPGPYPLFVWTPGTYEPHQDMLSLTFVAEMANRGFVGASVQYANLDSIHNCDTITARAKAIYDATQPTSAVGVLCSVNGVDCGLGIVTSGISQGGVISVLAKNYAPAVQATYALSVGDDNLLLPSTNASCIDDQYTAISPDRLMIVNGRSDLMFHGQTKVMNVSGVACPEGTNQCWSPTGSGAGWYIIQNWQVMDGFADHCYPVIGGCAAPLLFDRNWYLSSSNWALRPNLDWLATFGTKRVFSSSGQ